MSLLDTIAYDLPFLFDPESSFAIVAGWYPNADPALARERNILVFIDSVLLQEANQAVEGQEIRVQGIEEQFQQRILPGGPVGYNVNYNDLLVWDDIAYRIKSIQPDGTGVIEFIVAKAEDVVV